MSNKSKHNKILKSRVINPGDWATTGIIVNPRKFITELGYYGVLENAMDAGAEFIFDTENGVIWEHLPLPFKLSNPGLIPRHYWEPPRQYTIRCINGVECISCKDTVRPSEGDGVNKHG